MRKPTAEEFFAVYFVIWVVALVVVGMQVGTKSATIFWLSLAAVNISFVCLNTLGAIICMATGWVPWQDKPLSSQERPK